MDGGKLVFVRDRAVTTVSEWPQLRRLAAAVEIDWNGCLGSGASVDTDDHSLSFERDDETSTLDRSGVSARVTPLRVDEGILAALGVAAPRWLTAKAGVAADFELARQRRYGYDPSSDPIRFFVESSETLSWRPVHFNELGLIVGPASLSTGFSSTIAWGAARAESTTAGSLVIPRSARHSTNGEIPRPEPSSS